MSHTDERKELQIKVDNFLETRIPILDQIHDLCYAIEKCGASPQLTYAVIKAGALRESISELVNQALALGIGEGIVGVNFSDSSKPELGQVLPEDSKESSSEGVMQGSGVASGSNYSFTDPNLIAQLRECLRDHRVTSAGLRDLVVARLVKELGGSAADIKVSSNIQQSVNNCDTASSDALTEASTRGLGDLLPEFPWESIPTQQVLKYVGPVSFEYVWARTSEQLGHWKCTIAVNTAPVLTPEPVPTPEITQNGITEEVAFAAAIRVLKEIVYKNDWVLG
jgi:hypothetical protein